LMKDVLFLAASFYLLKQDVTRAAAVMSAGWGEAAERASALHDRV
jgi:hypothetical protein